MKAPNVRKGLLSRGHPLYQYPIFSTCPEILDLNRMHLSRSSSFQTFGLLFTDAAHTVIDRFLRLEGRVGPYGLAWHNEFEWPISRSLLSQFCGTQEALVNTVRARYETTKLHITFIAAGLPIRTGELERHGRPHGPRDTGQWASPRLVRRGTPAYQPASIGYALGEKRDGGVDRPHGRDGGAQSKCRPRPGRARAAPRRTVDGQTIRPAPCRVAMMRRHPTSRGREGGPGRHTARNRRRRERRGRAGV